MSYRNRERRRWERRLKRAWKQAMFSFYTTPRKIYFLGKEGLFEAMCDEKPKQISYSVDPGEVRDGRPLAKDSR